MRELRRGQIAAIVAGGGYGKTTLAIEYARAQGIGWTLARLEPGDEEPGALVARLKAAFRHAGLSDAAQALESGDEPYEAIAALVDLLERDVALLLILDEIGHATGGTEGLVRTLATELPNGSGLLLVGRSIPPALVPPADDSFVRLGPAELAFTTDETHAALERLAVPAGDSAPARLQRLTDGWPIAVLLAAERLARSRDPNGELDRLEATSTLLARLLDGPLDALPAEARRAIVQLAHLPDISVPIAERTTGVPRIVELGVEAGLPFEVDRGGRVELPDPVRDALASRESLAADVAARAAEAYVEQGQGTYAVRLLLGVGDADKAAAAAASLSLEELSRLDVRELRALLAPIPPAALDRHPRALLHLARSCEASAEREQRSELLGRVADAARDDAALRREVDAERARDLVRDGQVQQAREIAERLLADAGADELQTRVRALHVLGRTYAWSGEPEGLAAAEPLLAEAAELYGRLGFQSARAHALLALAYDVHTLGGRFDEAVDDLERALTGLPPRSRLRGVVLVFLAEALIDLGRLLEAEASLVEAERLGWLFGDTRTLAYTGWLRARAAGSLGDAGRVRAQLAEAERHQGEWYLHHTGAEFLAEASILLAQVGESAAAEKYLRRAAERESESPRHVMLARGAFEARYGDPRAADALLAELSARPDIDVREAWRPAALRAWAAHRAGDDDRARALAREAFVSASRTGAPDLPMRREPEIAAALLGLLDGTAADLAAPSPAETTITVLGGFEARRAGTILDIPAGRPASLVKLLAVHGGRRPVDAVIESLWAGVEPSSGRKRLRNVLNRLREGVGELVARDGDALVLVDAAAVDAALFERRALEAFAEPGTAVSIDRARAALGLYAGDALPDERYEDWAVEPRERLRTRALELLDLLAAGAVRDGDLDEALRLLERAMEIDRLDERRYVRAAELLLQQGRRGRALDVLRASASAMHELGLEPSPEHRALVRAARS